MASLHLFRHWDKIFWVFFLLMAITIVAGGAAGFISFEYSMLLGAFIVIVGAGKLASEISHRKLLNYQNDIYQKMHQISQHLEKTFNLASMNKDKTEFRIHKLDQKRKDVETKLNSNYREITKKLIELENRMNRLAKTMESKR